ncbi:MAG: hypothetical protein ABJN62_15560 [Halioglobus sp.]
MRAITAFYITFTIGFASSAIAESPDPIVAELRVCAAIDSREARFDCYEGLGQRALKSKEMETAETFPAAESGTGSPTVGNPNDGAAPAVIPATASAAATSTSAGPTSKNDEATIGGYQFETKSAAEKEAEQQMETRVVLCQRNREGTWYFKLENDQVWKQVDRQRLSFQGCDFGAKVTNDGIGYILRIDGRKGKIRIKRQK